jgi:kynureninase
MAPTFDTTPAWADAMDAADPLRTFRERFHVPKKQDGTDVIYFCGNSLGLQPKTARAAVLQELDDWETRAVEGHFHAKYPWLPYHEFLTPSTARLVGALPVEVVVMNSLTVNLHLMMVTFYRPSGDRTKIMIEHGSFPSDHYAVETHMRTHGLDPDEHLIQLAPRSGETTLRTSDLLERIERDGKDVALILLGGVNYYTGQAFDMRAITSAGHEQGCVVGFDLAHAAGNLRLHLHDWNVDFAVWCSYKYLNAGPGGIAGCFIHERHVSDPALPRFAGWWGHDKKTRFIMPPDFIPIPTAEGWQLSNPPIFQMAALRASLEIFDEAGMDTCRTKSETLTGYLEFLLDHLMKGRVTILTPRSTAERGCQLSLRVRDGKTVYERISRAGIVCDWREPDVIRVAPVPLYNTYRDVYEFVRILNTETH